MTNCQKCHCPRYIQAGEYYYGTMWTTYCVCGHADIEHNKYVKLKLASKCHLCSGKGKYDCIICSGHGYKQCPGHHHHKFNWLNCCRKSKKCSYDCDSKQRLSCEYCYGLGSIRCIHSTND